MSEPTKAASERYYLSGRTICRDREDEAGKTNSCVAEIVPHGREGMTAYDHDFGRRLVRVLNSHADLLAACRAARAVILRLLDHADHRDMEPSDAIELIDNGIAKADPPDANP